MAKQGLYANINKRKKAGTSRPKSKSTISAKAYKNMKAGFPKKKSHHVRSSIFHGRMTAKARNGVLVNRYLQ